MSRKETHMIRSHRSKRSYKPTNKTILNMEAKKRKKFHGLIRGMMSKFTY